MGVLLLFEAKGLDKDTQKNQVDDQNFIPLKTAEMMLPDQGFRR